MKPDASTSPFVPTRWTLVLRASGETVEARAALSELCESYYQPVFRFLRRQGRGEDAAKELAQEFFARLLQRGQLGKVDPARGRFRSYLLGAVKHFLADLRDHEGRQKRGGSVPHESLDAPAEGGESALQVPDLRAENSDVYFDRQWGMAVMDRALNAVEAGFRSAGKTVLFDTLKPWLAGDCAALSQSDAAKALGLNEGAVKVAIHRLRKQFRESIRAEIAQTLAEGGDIDAELRYLVEVLAQE